jgi:hypothetical protein
MVAGNSEKLTGQQWYKAFLNQSFLKEALVKSNYFRLVKIARIFPEDHSNRITITAHFVKDTNNFFYA